MEKRKYVRPTVIVLSMEGMTGIGADSVSCGAGGAQATPCGAGGSVALAAACAIGHAASGSCGPGGSHSGNCGNGQQPHTGAGAFCYSGAAAVACTSGIATGANGMCGAGTTVTHAACGGGPTGACQQGAAQLALSSS